MNSSVLKGTVVLVHGAWADGSCWRNIILPLRRQGLEVTAAPIPLTSLTDDVAALQRVLERTTGPVILAGHAYAGAVIAAAREERVKSLVYIAALAPDEGETVADVFYRAEPHPQAPHLAPDAHGLIWMPEEGFGHAVAHKASPDEATHSGGGTAADRAEMHSREGSRARVENETILVSDRGRGSND